MDSSSLLSMESLSTHATPRSSTSLDDLSINEHLHKLSIDNHLDTLPWILHYILERRLSCELPLRIMFSFNSGQKLPTLKQAQQWWQYEKEGKLIIEFLSSLDKITPSLDETPLEDLQNPTLGPPEAFDSIHDPRDRFMDAGNDLLLAIDFATKLGGDQRQSHGLPPSFIQDMCLNRFFTKEYKKVNFDQALTGMDYLRDLEVTRRASLRDAAQRLGITKENWRQVLSKDPDAKKWVEDEQAQELEIEIYYAQIFTDLRIWTMVNVLESQPFYKPNTVAMLNTLFPPSVGELANDRINANVLHGYRATFYRYILSVDAKGPSALKPLLGRLLRPGSRHSWPETRRNLEAYLKRADQMITQANAVYDVGFFRNKASLTSWAESGTDSFPIDRPLTSPRTPSFSARLSSDSTPSSPTGTFDSAHTFSKTRLRNVSTPVEQNTYFGPPESPWSSQTHRGKSRQSSRPATPSLANRRPSTALADTNLINSRNRNRTLSRPTTPFVESGSEAAHHTSFARPITPFEDKRREIVELRNTISSRPATPSELNRNRKLSAEVGSRPSSRPGSRASTFRQENSRHASVRRIASSTHLPSDNMEFLKHPYQPYSPSFSHTTLKKNSSLGSLFLRKKTSAGSETGTLRDSFNRQNPLGISLRPSTPVEPFPRFSIEDTVGFNEGTVGLNEDTDGSELDRLRLSNNRTAGPQPPKLKKQVSWVHLEKMDSSSIPLSNLQKIDTRSTAYSSRSNGSGLGVSGLSEITGNMHFKHRLNKQMSMPDIHTKNMGEDREKIFVPTRDEYLRFEVFDSPQLPPGKGVRKTSSVASMVLGKSDKAITIGGRGKRPRKSSLFRPEPTDEVITSKDICESFPVDLQEIGGSVMYENEEFRSKEYTRKWFLEESRARKFDLNRPAGDPIKEPEKKRFFMKRKTAPPDFELPRATPKPLVRPNKQRFDSIFPRRDVPKKQKPRTHIPIDISKYTKYPGIQVRFDAE